MLLQPPCFWYLLSFLVLICLYWSARKTILDSPLLGGWNYSTVRYCTCLITEGYDWWNNHTRETVFFFSPHRGHHSHRSTRTSRSDWATTFPTGRPSAPKYGSREPRRRSLTRKTTPRKSKAFSPKYGNATPKDYLPIISCTETETETLPTSLIR